MGSQGVLRTPESSKTRKKGTTLQSYLSRLCVFEGVISPSKKSVGALLTVRVDREFRRGAFLREKLLPLFAEVLVTTLASSLCLACE